MSEQRLKIVGNIEFPVGGFTVGETVELRVRCRVSKIEQGWDWGDGPGETTATLSMVGAEMLVFEEAD